jgi:hypothetical protein
MELQDGEAFLGEGRATCTARYKPARYAEAGFTGAWLMDSGFPPDSSGPAGAILRPVPRSLARPETASATAFRLTALRAGKSSRMHDTNKSSDRCRKITFMRFSACPHALPGGASSVIGT